MLNNNLFSITLSLDAALILLKNVTLYPDQMVKKLIACRSRKFIACHSHPSVLWCAKKESYAGPHEDFKNRLKQWIYTCRSLWIAGRCDSTLFGVVDDTTTTKFTGRACAVHCNSLPVVVDKVVVAVSF